MDLKRHRTLKQPLENRCHMTSDGMFLMADTTPQVSNYAPQG